MKNTGSKCCISLTCFKNIFKMLNRTCSSAGTRLVFFLDTGFEDGIYVMPVATGEPKLILAIPDRLSWVPFTRWRPAPDGT
jgi:hypothetical protein